MSIIGRIQLQRTVIIEIRKKKKAYLIKKYEKKTYLFKEIRKRNKKKITLPVFNYRNTIFEQKKR
jgi:hypothetical protein